MSTASSINLGEVDDLSPSQRNRLSRAFLLENSEQAANVRKIKVITFGLTAGLNLLDGLTADLGSSRPPIFSWPGSTPWRGWVSFTLVKSEEEKMYRSVASLEVFAGTTVGLRLRF